VIQLQAPKFKQHLLNSEVFHGVLCFVWSEKLIFLFLVPPLSRVALNQAFSLIFSFSTHHYTFLSHKTCPHITSNANEKTVQPWP
jgi:hypothetical protein